MDKTLIKESIKGVASDRPMLLLALAQLLAGLVYVIIVSLSIHVSDVTVYTRYTAFGEAHFYKNHWQYLLLFVLFGLIVTAAHLVLLAKLQGIGRRQSAFLVGWMGIAVLIIGCVYTLAVISLGRAA